MINTIAFHSNQLGLRGTEVALYDYAHYNEELLGNKSYIISCADSDLSSLKKFKNRFEVFLYKEFNECFNFVLEKNITHAYYIKAGDNDGKIIPGIKNLIHVVFQNKQIHGDKYAYVSEWLSHKMGMGSNFVPHIVKLPAPQINYRSTLNIPQNNIVIGRYGGYHEFDLPFVHNSIYETLTNRNDITFLFMNTKPFGPEHANIIFVNSTHNMQHKANFINTCDYMIHGRNHGESFGLSVCEFLYGGKPVISWKHGLDKNHITVLKDKGLWYEDGLQLTSLLANLKKNTILPETCKDLIQQFLPENVMSRFKKIFLD